MVRSHCPTLTQIMINSIEPIFVGLCIGLFVGQCEHTITLVRLSGAFQLLQLDNLIFTWLSQMDKLKFWKIIKIYLQQQAFLSVQVNLGVTRPVGGKFLSYSLFM